jgi:hypothetical protein
MTLGSSPEVGSDRRHFIYRSIATHVLRQWLYEHDSVIPKLYTHLTFIACYLICQVQNLVCFIADTKFPVLDIGAAFSCNWKVAYVTLSSLLGVLCSLWEMNCRSLAAESVVNSASSSLFLRKLRFEQSFVKAEVNYCKGLRKCGVNKWKIESIETRIKCRPLRLNKDNFLKNVYIRNTGQWYSYSWINCYVLGEMERNRKQNGENRWPRRTEL